jgi:hypothetical protein
MHAYEIRPRKDHRGVDLISDAHFPVQRFEVVSQCELRRQRHENRQ